ncbi:hypothetical protein RUND412_006910 [Rhizina undulata]
MAESPRPLPSSAFPHHHQLPPVPPPSIFSQTPGAAPRFSGPVLPPLANPNPGNLGPALPQHTAPQQQQPPHMPQHVQHSPAPMPHQQQQLHGNDRRVSTPYERLLPPQAQYNSPVNSTFSSPASFSYDRSYDQRRYSNESEQEQHRRRSSTMVPSPTYTVKRPPDESYGEDPHQNYPTRYTPTSVIEETVSTRREIQSSRSPGRYTIEVRQQPVAARACGFGERDRRVIDPPPIVQLIVNDPATGKPNSVEMRYPFNVVHCTLWSLDGQSDETALIGLDKRLTRRLMGTLVSSPFVGLDEEGKEGCFFCFPDLSCRTHGRYRLRFVLMHLEPSNLQPEGYTPIITEAMSDVFTVYTAKEFPGMRPSTALTKALKRQGCAISVKKGNEKAVGAAGGSGKDEGSGDEDTPSASAGKPKRRRKT